MRKKEDLEKLKKIQKLKEAEKAAVTQGVRNVNLNTSNDTKDAMAEQEVGKKYKDVSPRFSKGEFSSYTKYNPTPDNISASDNTQKRKNNSSLTEEERRQAIDKGIKQSDDILKRKKKK